MPRVAKNKTDTIVTVIPDSNASQETTGGDSTPPASNKITCNDPGWQDYVLEQFTDNEKDPEGNPTAEACRMVASRLLGTIVSEKVRTIQCPNQSNDYRAVIEVSIGIAWGGNREDVRIFEDVADVFPGNSDPKFAQFPTASAKTKALGRAYKSALMLKRVYTVEELATKEVETPGAGFEPVINLSQQRFINTLCRALDIDGFKFINWGERQYLHLTQVPYARAERMLQALNKFQQDPTSIPDEIQGYNADWQKTEGTQ